MWQVPLWALIVSCLVCFAAGFFSCGILSMSRTEYPEPPEHVAGIGVNGKGW